MMPAGNAMEDGWCVAATQGDTMGSVTADAPPAPRALKWAVRTDELDFDLPPELIAQEPAARRTDARLLHYRRDTGEIFHRHVRDLPQILRRGDLLVLNDTKVVPARFTLRKPTGGLVEGLWIDSEGHPFKRWHVLLRNLGRFEPGLELTFAGDPSATLRVLGKRGDDGYDVECSHDWEELLGRVGRMPLPPYIRRGKESDERDRADRERYQTAFAEAGTSVAAPTAGLHFDGAFLHRLEEDGIEWTSIRLHVGLGTFKPVDVEDLASHPMHREQWEIGEHGMNALNAAKATGRRIVAVGTTVVRTLESQPPGRIGRGRGETDLLIQPPYEFKHIDALITNFHLPRSTLLALVDAFVGTSERRRMYDEAIRRRYRFFSYGDAMLLER